MRIWKSEFNVAIASMGPFSTLVLVDGKVQDIKSHKENNFLIRRKHVRCGVFWKFLNFSVSKSYEVLLALPSHLNGFLFIFLSKTGDNIYNIQYKIVYFISSNETLKWAFRLFL